MSTVSTHRLIQAVCEERATAKQCAELERRVLADPIARREYVDAMNVHAALAWDATEPSASPRVRPHRRAIAAALASTAAAGLLAVGLWPDAPPDAVPQSQVATADPAESAGETDSIAATVKDVPKIAATDAPAGPQPTSHAMLPPRPSPVAASDLRVADSIEGPAVASELSGGASPSLAERLSRIDAAIAKRLSEEGVQPSPRANPSDWLRRASLDLRGRIPTPPEIDAFLAADESTRRKAFIDAAVTSDEFADHFGTWWATLLVGRSAERQAYRTRLRHWIADEVALGTSWDRIAGELIAARGGEEHPPTNFLLAHLNNQAVPATAITSRVLLGRQVQCTQCHRHPWNDAGQDQFWQLNAFFKQAEIRTEGGRRVLADRTDGGPVYYETLSGVMQVAYPTWGGVEASRDDGVPRRQELARLLADDDDAPLAEAMSARLWQKLIGASLTPRVDDLGPHAAISHPAVLAELTAAMRDAGYDVRELARLIASTEVYQRSSEPTATASHDRPEEGRTPLYSRTYVKPLSAEQIYDSIVTASQGTARVDETAAALPSRDGWTSRFYQAQDNEENGDLSTFDGSVNQALSLMNGELVAAAVQSPRATALDAALASDGPASERLERVLRLSLGRQPLDAEQAALSPMLKVAIREHGRRLPPEAAIREGLRDVFWASLNSNRFALNY